MTIKDFVEACMNLNKKNQLCYSLKFLEESKTITHLNMHFKKKHI